MRDGRIEFIRISTLQRHGSIMSMNTARPARRETMPPRQRIRFVVSLLLISTALSLLLVARSAALPTAWSWAILALTPLIAVVLWFVARSQPLNVRLAQAAIALIVVRVGLVLVVALQTAGFGLATIVFNVGLPAFYIYFVSTAIRDIRREPDAATGPGAGR
jgi:hypothetical protein